LINDCEKINEKQKILVVKININFGASFFASFVYPLRTGAIAIATTKNISGRIDFSNLLRKYASFAVFAVNPIAIVKNEKRKNVRTILPSPGLILINFLINFKANSLVIS
tara:strand:- start:41 stop:370 length:330 start_codon:yes stop_codon:yes gene_type:complete